MQVWRVRACREPDNPPHPTLHLRASETCQASHQYDRLLPGNMAPRKFSLAAFVSLLKKKPAAKNKILVLGAGEPVGEAVLAAIVQRYSKDLNIVAAVSTRPESQKLLQRHPSIRTTIGNVENPAFLETAAQTAKIVINTHASPSSSAATAAAHLVHVLSLNACTHTFYIHTSSTAILEAPPCDLAAQRNETTTTKAREETQSKRKNDLRASVNRIWNDVADIDEICARPASAGYARVDAAVREATRAAEKRSGKRKKKGGQQRVRLAVVAPGLVYGNASSSSHGSSSPQEPFGGVFKRDEREVGVVHVVDLVQLYLRLVEKAVLVPSAQGKIEEKDRPWDRREWAWEECWGLHAFYFAVAEHMSVGELRRLHAERSRRIEEDECCGDQESDGMAEEKDSDVVVGMRYYSERAKWILGWVPHEWHDL
ncbi:hypothetical protein IWX90DRAFT_428881 [Phyllosticta citrichinensis]|uniref:Saccharopine dehydrogenase NADP binding domain-containing protein n=1 Tax=Phyllosticta citrichinensis TaxID=1130410 RepID=A0ABR1Y0R2_9PEZI